MEISSLAATCLHHALAPSNQAPVRAARGLCPAGVRERQDSGSGSDGPQADPAPNREPPVVGYLIACNWATERMRPAVPRDLGIPAAATKPEDLRCRPCATPRDSTPLAANTGRHEGSRTVGFAIEVQFLLPPRPCLTKTASLSISVF